MSATRTPMSSEHKAWTILGVVTIIVVGVILTAIVWAGERATDHDRRSRSVRASACATIEDEKVRALCLFSVPGR
jgi:flagellar basal body-associated protein FliL